MADLFLVRHGETVWHLENRYAGSTDIDLSHQGRTQAQALARWARSANLDAMWCSELRRSLDTAAPCAKASGLELKIDARLNEVGFGVGEGLTLDELEERFPQKAAAFQADPVAHPLPGGEDLRAAAQRAVAVLGEIVHEFPRGRILVVSHNSLIRLALCQILNLPLTEYRNRFESVRNCHLNQVQITPGAPPALLQFNTPLRKSQVPTGEAEECLG